MVNYSGNVGNIMSRLAGLKSVSGNRRVMPESDLLPDELINNDYMSIPQPETPPPLPNFENLAPPKENLPESDLGGELTSQSYDIRANSAMPQQQDSSFWSKVGSALADYVTPKRIYGRGQQPPIATQQVDLQEGLPPTTASQEKAAEEEPMGVYESLRSQAAKPFSGMGISKIGNALNTAKDYIKEEFTPTLTPQFFEKNPHVKKPQYILDQERKTQEEINKTQLNPHNVIVYGATDSFANSPELVSDFAKYTGINFDKQVKQQTEKYEKVLSDIENGLIENDNSYDEQERRIKERILNNQSTDADKYYVGLALLMPLLVGGIFGKEAGLGALGGTAKGFADVLGQRQKEIRADEESLSDIYNKRSTQNLKRNELELERMKIPGEIRKNLPKDEFEDLKGLTIHKFKDPETGKVVGEGAEVLPDLYLDLKYGNTPKRREKMMEEASKLEQDKAALEVANVATSDIMKAATQLNDSGLFGKILAYGLSDDNNGALKKIVRQMSPDIMADGRKQNAAVYIDGKIELLKDAYRRNEQMKAYTNTVANHLGAIVDNPIYTGLKGKDLIDQTLNLRDRAQQFFVDRAASQGFLKEPLMNKFGELNRQLYRELNKKEENKEVESLKQESYKSD